VTEWRLPMRKKYAFASLFILLSVFPFQHLNASENVGLSDGQTIYVPAYSHIYSGNKETPFSLTVTLSIRNIDRHHNIKIVLVDYYETQGKLQKNLLILR
jgi:hypothetical protein